MLIDDPKRTNVLEEYVAQYSPNTFFKNAQKYDLKTAFQEDWEMTKDHLTRVWKCISSQVHDSLDRRGMEILGLPAADEYSRIKKWYRQKE